MIRISSNMNHNDLQGAMRNQEFKMNRLNNQIGSQQKVLDLRDDPLAAGHGIRYQSYLSRLERFEKNTKIVNDQYRVAEGYMNQSVQILHRLRELTIGGANGTFTKDDLKNTAGEVDELLKELLVNANAEGPDGNFLFSGTRSTSKSFITVEGSVPGSVSPMITSVQYQGSIGENSVEIDEGAFISMDKSGNRVFWAENQQLFSDVDATNYQVPNDTSIDVDGVNIPLTAGDNVHAIIAKINDSGAAVRAYLDPVTQGLNLETTDPRQLWIQDAEGGNTLANLGLVNEGQRPPYNFSSSVKTGGGSLFDVVIGIRDAMLSGDQEYLGGRALQGLDGSLQNLTSRVAKLGAQTERLDMAQKRLATQIPVVTGWEARELDLDFAEAITNLKMIDYAKQATMGTIGRLYSNSLLNYLK